MPGPTPVHDGPPLRHGGWLPIDGSPWGDGERHFVTVPKHWTAKKTGGIN